jgi:hypothetical protein
MAHSEQGNESHENGVNVCVSAGDKKQQTVDANHILRIVDQVAIPARPQFGVLQKLLNDFGRLVPTRQKFEIIYWRFIKNTVQNAAVFQVRKGIARRIKMGVQIDKQKPNSRLDQKSIFKTQIRFILPETQTPKAQSYKKDNNPNKRIQN